MFLKRRHKVKEGRTQWIELQFPDYLQSKLLCLGVAECLPIKCKALSLISSPGKDKNKQTKKQPAVLLPVYYSGFSLRFCSFNKYLLSVSAMPGTVLGTWDTLVKKGFMVFASQLRVEKLQF